MQLFSPSSEPIKYDLPDASLEYYPAFIDKRWADILFNQLMEQTQWRQDDIKIFGKTYPQPRLTALYGEDGKPYSYSGIQMHPIPFTPLLLELKSKIEEISRAEFTTVLLNLYRDGSDSNGWHSDDEKELGVNPLIASLSLGEKRKFHLRHRSDPDQKLHMELEHGSLLIMGGTTQHHWKHQLPKSKRKMEPRINLTFRKVCG